VLFVIRQSQGEDDDTASLRFQRKVVPRLARDVAGDWEHVDSLDLGVHTGYSIHSRDRDDTRIDANPDVVQALQRVEEGVYAFIVGLDDARLARDDYFAEWKRVAALGDAEFVFFEDGAEVGTLTHDVRRKVEEHIKAWELEKALAALSDRESEGKWNHEPPTGLEFDAKRDYLQPGENYYKCLQVLVMRDAGESWSTIADRVGMSRSTVRNIYGRAQMYCVYVDRTGVHTGPKPVPAD
jgi:hypothetical protein